MAFGSVTDSMQSYETMIINNFVEKLCIFFFPHNLEMQRQFSLAVEAEQQQMDYWRVAHGLPNYPPTRGNLTATPPMPLPFIDHHTSALDNNLATSFGESESNFNTGPTAYWTSGSSNSSPFRQANHHGMTGGTVSPRELLSHEAHPTVPPAPYNDDMGMFTFSDSETSLPSLPQPPLTSTHRRKTGQRFGTSRRYSQSHTHQQARHPLPAGPGDAASRGHIEGFGTYLAPFGNELGQQSYLAGGHGQEVQTPPDFTLRSNVSAYNNGNHNNKSSRSSHRRSTASVQTHAFGGPLNMVSPALNPLHIFPPGQDMPGFVPIGRVGIANAAQGNRWPIERDLFEKIVGAERGHGEHRPKTALTYKEILAKYSRWDIKESTLRGIKRKITLPKEHRERKPKWHAEHINSLCHHVPIYTDKKGKTSWTQVVEAIKRDTGRPFGAGTTSKKWNDLNRNKAWKDSALAQPSHGGREEQEMEETDSSLSDVEIVDVSEEDLPSHQFSFQKDDL